LFLVYIYFTVDLEPSKYHQRAFFNSFVSLVLKLILYVILSIWRLDDIDSCYWKYS